MKHLCCVLGAHGGEGESTGTISSTLRQKKSSTVKDHCHGLDREPDGRLAQGGVVAVLLKTKKREGLPHWQVGGKREKKGARSSATRPYPEKSRFPQR